MGNLTKDELENERNIINSLSTSDKNKVETNEKLLKYIDGKEYLDLRFDALWKYVELNKEDALPKLLDIINNKSEDIYYRESVVGYLSDIQSPKATDALLGFSKHKKLKRAALEGLAKLGIKDAWPEVIKEIIERERPYERIIMAEGFRSGEQDDWKTRLNEVLNYLKNTDYSTGNIDPTALIEAIRPEKGWPKNQDELISCLINESLDQNLRITRIIGKLIIECCNGSQSIAAQKINEFEVDKNIPTGKLNDLRVTIGGQEAFSSLLHVLEENLRDNFQKPISELNENTKEMWNKTIKYAQYGFIVRIGMSIIVFIVGMFLLIASSWELLFSDLDLDTLYGPGISFVTGLGMMITIVYSGPLKQIRKSINDLGISSAAFIAYIHRVLEISHTFSYYYLNQKISFDEMKISSDLINDAMNHTVDVLNIKDIKK